MLAMGAKAVYIHMCGDHNLNLPQWAQVPSGREDARHDRRGQRDRPGGRHQILPRRRHLRILDPAIIVNGTAEEVYKASCEIIERARPCCPPV